MTQPKDAKRLTSGQVGPKCRVWGGSPTSIFSGPPGPEKKQVSIHLPCLPFSARHGNDTSIFSVGILDFTVRGRVYALLVY